MHNLCNGFHGIKVINNEANEIGVNEWISIVNISDRVSLEMTVKYLQEIQRQITDLLTDHHHHCKSQNNIFILLLCPSPPGFSLETELPSLQKPLGLTANLPPLIRWQPHLSLPRAILWTTPLIRCSARE